jgi:hypothetical protein
MNFLIAIVDDDESYRAATTDLVRCDSNPEVRV